MALLYQRAEEYAWCITIDVCPYGGYFMVLKQHVNYLKISNEPQSMT